MIRVRLRIHWNCRLTIRDVLAVVLLPLVLLVALGFGHAYATVASSASSTAATLGVRQYYLTPAVHNGAQASTVCAEGYHFASIWEIADPSALEYNTALGATSADSGAGPPTKLPGFMVSITARGWVRTGYAASTSGTAGWGNCDAWSSDDDAHSGTVANLPDDWSGGTQDVGVWNAEVKACDTNQRVWCVQDDSVLRVFLPLVLRND